MVAIESFWGSIATQLGGDRVRVSSVISSPGVDPHEYEPTIRDARAIAAADYVIVNGVGYDRWAQNLLDASPVAQRRVLDIGSLVGEKEGANPHRWYFPDDVEHVVAQITNEYQRLDPSDARYFDEQRAAFESDGLGEYRQLLHEIEQRHAGTAVGASESLFVGIAEATRLDLRTPAHFLEAVSEGTDPVASDKAVVDRQITGREIKVFVYNSQNATPDVVTLVHEAEHADVPVVAMTETQPEGVAFQEWQTQQLRALLDALDRAAPT